MKLQVLALVIGALLAGCGGGGSDGAATPAPAPAAQPLAQYAGTWRQGCEFHVIETTVVTMAADGSASIWPKEEYFANADCSGAVVATGTFAAAPIAIRYVGTSPSASVKQLNGQIIPANVDRISATSVAMSQTYAGSGVTPKTVNGKLVWTITYTGGTTTINEAGTSEGTVSGGMAVVGGEMWTMQPVGSSTTSFEMDGRYIR